MSDDYSKIIPYLTKIDAKVEKIDDDIVEIKVTMARNTVSLEEHMKRSDSLERIANQNQVKAEVVSDKVASIFTVIYVGKWILGSSIVVGGIVALAKMLG